VITIPTKTNATSFSMPVIGLGTWEMGGRVEHNPNNDDERDIQAIREAVVTCGITHIDTAELYAAGHSETLVAQALVGIPRASFQIATKVSGNHLGYDATLKSCEDSLKRLQTDFVDLYYVHIRNKAVPLKETARALNKLHRDGRVKNVGVCNFNVESLKELEPLLDVPIAANQCHYNLVYREPEQANLLEYCEKNGITFVAWRPVLWNEATRFNQPKGSAWERGVYPILDEMAKKYGKPTIQVAVNWLINQPNICTLVKASQIKHLQEILGCLTWTLSPEDIERLRAGFPDQRSISCAVPLG